MGERAREGESAKPYFEQKVSETRPGSGLGLDLGLGLRVKREKKKKSRPQWESNPRPSDPKSDALIHCAMRSWCEQGRVSFNIFQYRTSFPFQEELILDTTNYSYPFFFLHF